jgi:hypothetical protein
MDKIKLPKTPPKLPKRPAEESEAEKWANSPGLRPPK